jgi:hypothetical protein
MGGVSVELVHLGSLYHDDVMDDAATRRTVDSVNARWGNLKAILAGDFLLARASEIAAALGTEVAGLLANTIARLCEGQVRELQDAYNVDRREDDCFSSIAGKTAALLARRAASVASSPTCPDRSSRPSPTSAGRTAWRSRSSTTSSCRVERRGSASPPGNGLVGHLHVACAARHAASDASAELREILGDKLDDDDRDQAGHRPCRRRRRRGAGHRSDRRSSGQALRRSRVRGRRVARAAADHLISRSRNGRRALMGASPGEADLSIARRHPGVPPPSRAARSTPTRSSPASRTTCTTSSSRFAMTARW